MTNAVEIRGLVKSYPGFRLGPIDLTLPGGCILALYFYTGIFIPGINISPESDTFVIIIIRNRQRRIRNYNVILNLL